MPRLTEVADILFPVAEYPVFVRLADPSGERRLPVPDKKAIIHTGNHRVLGIVGRGYRLVTNHEALEWGLECCRAVFPETNPAEWKVEATDAPASGAHCFIDLVHNSGRLDFSLVSADGRPDVFGPFIKVTNSYNGARALGFDIGFWRKACKNGLLLKDTVIRFKFIHARRSIGKKIQFKISHQKLDKLKSTFAEYVATLRYCSVPRQEFPRFVKGALSIYRPDKLEPNTRIAKEWKTLDEFILTQCTHFADELGDNAYAVLNVVTYLASHPPLNCCIRRDRNSLQRQAGRWLSSFIEKYREPNFDVLAYIDELVKPPETTIGQVEAGAGPLFEQRVA